MLIKRALHIFTVLGITAFLLCGQEALARQSHKKALAIAHPAEKQEKGTANFSGNISWYGPQFNGKKTASGEVFDMNKSTAAHLTLPFGSKVLVEDPRTGKTVIVKVNDRGPYVRSRVMDLSKEGARKLGTLLTGVAFVDCLVLSPQGAR